jgi:hypothetical protein
MERCMIADRWFKYVASRCCVNENTLGARIKEMMVAYYDKETM